VVDSLGAAESAARAAGSTARAELLASAGRAAVAELEALEARVGQLTLRAISPGELVTARPEDLIGRRVVPGDSLLQVATLDSVEVRVVLAGGGATRVRTGDVVHLLSMADPATPVIARVAEMSVGGGAAGQSHGTVEARIRLAGGPAWRPGMRGEAKVDLQRSLVIGAIIWKLRQVVRGDLWL
jgi:multidrug resistance efflux pump